MKNKIVIPIKEIILTKKNILGLANCVSKQEDARMMRFMIKFTNDMEIESDDVSVFENEKFTEYEIKCIYMGFEDKEFKKQIDIFIFNYSGESTATISYENDGDSDWLAVTESIIREQLSFCDETNKVCRYLRKEWLFMLLVSIINIFVAIVIGRIIIKIVNFDEKTHITINLFIFCVLELFMVGWKNLFDKAYPSLEIFIKERTDKSKRARNILKIIASSFIIPIIVERVLEFLKRE